MAINYGRQTIGEDDIKAVSDVLRSDFLTTGPLVDRFEKRFAEFVGARFAVAVSNGTAALHLACLAAGVKGGEVITSPITFAASANCALYCGARPVFADIDKHGLINPEEVEKSVTKKTRALIPVHLAGLPCNMEQISAIAKKHGLTVIEDCSHALGAEYKGSRIGDCRHSDMCTFSFHPVKLMTTGEGGMITTNSEKIYKRLKKLRNHGITKEPKEFVGRPDGPWYHEIQELGYNYRLTDIQCALGLGQLTKAERFIRDRQKIAGKYQKELGPVREIELIGVPNDRTHAYHLFIIMLDTPKKRLGLFEHLSKSGINCQVHYIPVYLHPLYQGLGYERGLCPRAEEFYGRILSIPIYPGLTDEETDTIITSIKEFF
jgi:UDP-4-amino-4,6-dideoxy-N-acetyl-beta-L-altrosamine transaminase